MIIYKKLWKLLIDKGMNKTQFRLLAGLTTPTLAKLGKSEHVSTETINKICKALNVQLADIMEYIPDKEDN